MHVEVVFVEDPLDCVHVEREFVCAQWFFVDFVFGSISGDEFGKDMDEE